MKQSSLITLFILILTVVQSTTAQNEVKLRDIECYNLGDGRYFCHYRETKKPLQGNSRIIDGYTTQYIEAVFKDGIPNGSWKIYKYNKLAEEFTYEKGILNGQNKEYYEDGSVRILRTYEKGELNGPYMEYYPDGSVKVLRNFVKGKPDGKFLQYGSNGKIESEVNYKNGLQDGPEIRYDSESNVRSQSNYAAGKTTGKEVKNYEDYVQTANYNKEGKYDGEYSEIYTNGNIKQKGKYVNGKKDGTWEYGKKNGQKTRTDVYANDEKIKETFYYTDNTVEVIRELKNGQKNGWERKYNYGDGSLKSEIFYKEGQASSETGSGGPAKQTKQITGNWGVYVQIFYEINGKYEGEYTEQWMEGTKGMKAKGQYKNGKKTGHWIYEDKYGKKEKEENYLDGELDGTCIRYCDNGKPSQVYEYTKGEKNGPYKEYWCNTGALMVTGTYVAGRVKGIRTYYESNGKVSSEEEIK
jgi:antitoxin component YwqK of YwqJK toxin-antitoxin module